jgi:hypothetical protein
MYRVKQSLVPVNQIGQGVGSGQLMMIINSSDNVNGPTIFLNNVKLGAHRVAN